MFLEIAFVNNQIDGQYGMSLTNYKIYDSEFESNIYSVKDTACIEPRLIIHEYSQRSLNVAANLKLFFSRKYEDKQFRESRRSYHGALLDLENMRYTLNVHYPHLNYDIYHECLRRHIHRMKWAGRLKNA